MNIIKTIIFSLLFFAAIVFAVDNNVNVSVSFYGLGSTYLPLFIVVFISVFLGIIIAGLIGGIEGVRFRMEIGRLKKQIKEQEKEINSLRNLPLSESTELSKTE
ncbi:MAG: lipopolysaccharide assembly LapA domain-containing protein [Thermodesulfobacteriota bacterium]